MTLTKLGNIVNQNPSSKNVIINGNFDVWQRNTVQSISGYGSADRWSIGWAGAGSTMSLERVYFALGQTDVPGEPESHGRVTFTTGGTAGEWAALIQAIEDVRILSGQEVTVSFRAKANAPNKYLTFEFCYNYGVGGSTRLTDIGVNKFELTTSWEKYTTTLLLPSISGKTLGLGHKIESNFWVSAGTEYDVRTDSLGNQSIVLDISQVQIEKGPVATEFKKKTYAEEILDCYRYYQGDMPYVWSGYVTSGSVYYLDVPLIIPMRSSPSLIATYGGSSGFPAVSPTVSANGVKVVRIYQTGNSTGPNGLFYGTFSASSEI